MNSLIHRYSCAIEVEHSKCSVILAFGGVSFVDKLSFVFVLFLFVALVCVWCTTEIYCSIHANSSIYAHCYTRWVIEFRINWICSWTNKMAHLMHNVHIVFLHYLRHLVKAKYNQRLVSMCFDWQPRQGQMSRKNKTLLFRGASIEIVYRAFWFNFKETKENFRIIWDIHPFGIGD